ncbi:hypothetical protein TNCV_4182581 [Trichonephila clavipes]|nr:hypothetical protein TNCV_4182581 [Trichonephila clavipes]
MIANSTHTKLGLPKWRVVLNVGDCAKIRKYCDVATPSSGRNLWWTRYPHVHLAAAAQPLFDPRGIEHRRPEDERERCFELTRERWPTNPPLTKYWTLTFYN